MNNAILAFSFGAHLAFVIFGTIFFFLQFARLKYKYHLIMGIAIPLSLLIHVATTKTFFYAIGVIEIILLLLCAVNISVERRKLASMHTIKETMQKMDTESEIENEIPAERPTPKTGLTKKEEFVENPLDTINTWLDNLADKTYDERSNEKEKEKPRELKTGWVDFNINDE